MGPSDSLLPARSGYLFPAQVEASFLAPGPQGLPSSWSFFSVRAVSFHPGESAWASQYHSSQAILVSSFMGA